MTGPGTHQRGFTLIELLLAMLLVAMIVATAYGSLRAATRAAERGQQIVDESTHVRAAHQFVRRQLAHALPLTYSVEDAAAAGPDAVQGQFRTVFEGDGRAVQFVATMPGYLGYGGPQVQRIEVAPHGEHSALWFLHAPVQTFAIDGAFVGDPVLLLENIDDARFHYLAQDLQGQIVGWIEQWDQPDRVPMAISLDVTMADERSMGWPQLVANVRIDEEAVTAAQGNNAAYEDAIRALIRGDRTEDQRNPD